MSQTKRYYVGLDVVRGLSCILIMLYHYTVRYNSNPLFSDMSTHWLFRVPWGCAAVTTFFLLSGFLGGRHIFIPKGSITDYLKGRFMRLFPSFAISVLSTTLVTTLLFPSAACNTIEVLLNLTMIPALLGVRYVDGAYWTMQVEWTFYIITAFSMLFIETNNKKRLILLWLIISILGNIIYAITYNPLINKLNILLISNHSQEFLTGVAIYLLISQREKRFSTIIIVLAFFNQLLTQDCDHIIFFLISGILIFLLTFYQSDGFFKGYCFRFICWIGHISYPVYLLHQIIGFVVIYYLQQYGYTSTAYIIIPIMISIILGYTVQLINDKCVLKYTK